MAGYSLGELVQAARDAGFSAAALVTAVAVSLAENAGRDPLAVNTNADGSRDRGPWQINDQAHPDVGDACAFDLQCSARAAFTISSQGRDWNPWTTYLSGAYQRYLPDAQGAVGDSAGSTSGGDASGIGGAIQAVTAQAVSAGQVAAGGVLLLLGLLAAALLVLRVRGGP